MGVLGAEPWRRAPRLLLRHRAVLAAIAGTCALLAIAAASGPLFLASAGAAALQRRVADQCPEADRPAVAAAADDPGVVGAFTAAGLPAPYRVVEDGITAPFGINTTPIGLTLYNRPDALDHVRRVAGGGQGLLGAACAVGFAAAVRGMLDVNPLYPPGALLVLPLGVLGIGIAVLLAVAGTGALGTQRVADAAEPAVLLRGADS